MDLLKMSEEALKAAWLDCLLRIEQEQVTIRAIQQQIIARQQNDKKVAEATESLPDA